MKPLGHVASTETLNGRAAGLPGEVEGRVNWMSAGWSAAILLSALIVLWPSSPPPLIEPMDKPVIEVRTPHLGGLQSVGDVVVVVRRVELGAASLEPALQRLMVVANQPRVKLGFAIPRNENDGGFSSGTVVKGAVDTRYRLETVHGFHAVRLRPAVPADRPFVVEVSVRVLSTKNPWSGAPQGPTHVTLQLFSETRGRAVGTFFAGSTEKLANWKRFSLTYSELSSLEEFSVRTAVDAWTGNDLVEIGLIRFSCLFC